MEPKRYALVDANGLVVNVILWDGVEEFTPPDKTQAIQSDTAQRGDTWDGTQFISPPQPADQSGE